MPGDPRSLLQGAWRIIDRSEGGEDTREPDDDDKFLWFKEDVSISGDKWAAWQMPYTCTGTPEKGVLEITREDHREPWIAVAIFAITGLVLRLCMGSKSEDLPTGFESTKENGFVCYRAERCEEPIPD